MPSLLLALLLAAAPAGPLELVLKPPRGLQVGEVGRLDLAYRNTGKTPLRLHFGTTCGADDIETPLLDGENAGLAMVTMCGPDEKDVIYTVKPRGSLRSTVELEPRAAGRHKVEVRYRVAKGPPDVFQGEVVSNAVEVEVAPPDPPGPVVELHLPKHIRAGRPFTVELRHHNGGKRGWILFNEKCSGPPRNFLVVDGEERAIPSKGPCKPDWDDRMTLAPGRRFVTRTQVTLPAGRHTLQGLYRLGAAYEKAAVWVGEAASPVVEVSVD